MEDVLILPLKQNTGLNIPGSLEDRIETLQNYMKSSIRNLNGGGCCIFAYYMSKALTYMNIDHEIIAQSHLNTEDWNIEKDYFMQNTQ